MEWVAELYVHALAVEAEAARRHRELAQRIGNPDAARLFLEFSAQEERHLQALRRECAGMALPPLTADHSWVANGAPLAAALQAEKDAQAFFEQAKRIAQEPAARALAEEMAREEREHIARIERLIRGSA